MIESDEIESQVIVNKEIVTLKSKKREKAKNDDPCCSFKSLSITKETLGRLFLGNK